MATDYRPPAGFYFTVQVVGSASWATALTSVDASFREVSGISVDASVEEVSEGGENRFVHKLPRPARYSNLVLERGVVTSSSILGEWVQQMIGSRLAQPIITQNIVVMLLDGSGSPTIAWGFVNAYPVRWEVSTLAAQSNEVLTEKLEFSYNYFLRLTLNPGLPAVVAASQLRAELS